MDQERLSVFLHSLEPEPAPLVRSMEEYARENFVPIVRKETASLLKTLVAMYQPESILEVGTAIGYSALRMSENMPENCHITTIEKFEKRIPIARENFRLAGMEDRISLLEGDATEILASLQGPYDFIFMDAAKGQYLTWLPEVTRLLAVGGILVTDNILQDGTLLESRYAVTRRDRTIHSRMREYLYELKHRDDVQTSIVPIGDGISISVRLR